jgi:hypothetical protein
MAVRVESWRETNAAPISRIGAALYFPQSITDASARLLWTHRNTFEEWRGEFVNDSLL